jgi:hypothetical protein
MKTESSSESCKRGDGYEIRPRLVLVNGLRRDTSADLYNDIAGRLRARRIEVEIIHGLNGALPDLRNYDLLISNVVMPATMQADVPTYAGRKISRPTSLRLLEEFDVPTMEWALARTRREVRALFTNWGIERVLLKPSFTYGGKGFRVFTQSAVWRLRWKRELDVFCPEINPDDGDVYKAELLNGRVLISWKSAAPPIRMLFRRGIHRGLRGAYGERSLWELPSDLTVKLEAISQRLTTHGLSHVSVDLMRRPDGELVAIELNSGSVATWWTRQFSDFRNRYTDALYELAMQHRLKS